jgi:hypothetical protein
MATLLFFVICFMAFCAFLNKGGPGGGVQKNHENLFGESPCQKLLAEKVEEIFFSCRLLPSTFLSRFWPKHFLKKVRPENLKKSKLSPEN